MNEISALRQEYNKTFELDPALGLGQYQLEARTGPIHYKSAYRDSDPWLDLDEEYSEDLGTYRLYPKLPNITKVYKNQAAYEIQNRHNPLHNIRVELVSVNGFDVSNWVDDRDVSVYAKVHPIRVGIWKQFKRARNKAWTIRWKITETGKDESAIYAMSFRDDIDAWSVINPDENSVKIAVTGTRTRIDDNSWFWDEAIPKGAMLVDTDYQPAAGGDDGMAYSTIGFDNSLTYTNIGTDYYLFARFPSFGIEKSSTIDSATINFKANGTRSTTTVNVNIYCNAADNATAPTDYDSYFAKSLTSAVAWNNVATWTNSTWSASPSIITPIQAVVDRSGWVKNNAMLILIKNNSSTGGSNRSALSYNSSSASSPKVTVTWTEPTSTIPVFSYYYNNMRP